MKESMFALILAATVAMFGSALHRPIHSDVLNDDRIGPRLRAMVREGRVPLLPEAPIASQSVRAAESGAIG